MDDDLTPTRIWDLPTRIFHWLLALCVIGSICSARIGGDAMVWHFRLGYAVFTLIAFRVLWGLVGGRWSRFASFIYPPAAIGRYLRGEPRAGEHFEVGHNPLGALAIFAMLALLAAQVATGLFADDEISNTGPLNTLVSGPTSRSLTHWHRLFGQWTIIALLVLHVVAIFWYLFRKKRDLLGPMIRGDKPLAAGVPASTDSVATRLLALVLVALCAAGLAWLISLGS
jgi:cytochrome b